MEDHRFPNSRRKAWRRCAWTAIALLSTYLGEAFVVFEFSSPVFLDDEDTKDGQIVAIDPQPRTFVFPATRYELRYTGNEWPFAVYRSLCWALCKGKGFAVAT